jgi:predicted molibdopterin-dependent oxidoreductase YjgC
MIIRTSSDEILKTRKINLKLLFCQHVEKCSECIWSNKCKMLNYAKDWGLCINEWEDRKKNYPKYSFGGVIDYDSSKCINCSNCVEICKNQGVGFLEIKKQGSFHSVVPSQDKNKDEYIVAMRSS